MLNPKKMSEDMLSQKIALLDSWLEDNLHLEYSTDEDEKKRYNAVEWRYTTLLDEYINRIERAYRSIDE